MHLFLVCLGLSCLLAGGTVTLILTSKGIAREEFESNLGELAVTDGLGFLQGGGIVAWSDEFRLPLVLLGASLLVIAMLA